MPGSFPVDCCIRFGGKEYILNSRPERFVNLLSAILVLLAGFYVIIFLPLRISGTARILIGVILTIYFLIRIRVYWGRYGRSKSEDVIDVHDHNKTLDKDAN